MADKLSN